MQHCEINGVEVSRIGLDTGALGRTEGSRVSDGDALRTCLAALEQGINLIDAAPVDGYVSTQGTGSRPAQGRAERILGTAIAQHACREDFYIATKYTLDCAALSVPISSLAAGNPARHVERELGHSLRRLNTAYVDLYLAHCEQRHGLDPLMVSESDSMLVVEQVAERMGALLREGRIRAIGVSNLSVEQMDCFRAVAPIHAAQLPYNLFERETDLLLYCQLYGIAVIATNPLCRGLLAGQLTAATEFADSDIRSGDLRFQTPRFVQYLAAVERLQAFAAQHYGRSVAELAVRWVLDRRGVSAALWGAERPEQVTVAARSLGWHLDVRARGFIEEIVRQAVTDPVPAGIAGSRDQIAGSHP